MHSKTLLSATASAFLMVAWAAGPGPASADDRTVISDTTVTGFKYPESVAYDPTANVLYVSEFGSELKPTEMDGEGRISRVALDGTIEDEVFLPASGQILHKPKGIWVAGERLWVTDIDSVWVFDTGTRQGKKVELPEAEFANDVTVIDDSLYVSDNRSDKLFRVEPADFLNMEGDPAVTQVLSGESINPNGLYPAADGSLLMVGFKSADEARGIYSTSPGGEPETLVGDLGRLDGVYELEDGALLVTEWNSGSLSLWSADEGMRELASGFEGPADFGVVPNSEGLLVVVPDLVKSELRLIQLSE